MKEAPNRNLTPEEVAAWLTRATADPESHDLARLIQQLDHDTLAPAAGVMLGKCASTSEGMLRTAQGLHGAAQCVPMLGVLLGLAAGGLESLRALEKLTDEFKERADVAPVVTWKRAEPPKIKLHLVDGNPDQN